MRLHQIEQVFDNRLTPIRPFGYLEILKHISCLGRLELVGRTQSPDHEIMPVLRTSENMHPFRYDHIKDRLLRLRVLLCSRKRPGKLFGRQTASRPCDKALALLITHAQQPVASVG